MLAVAVLVSVAPEETSYIYQITTPQCQGVPRNQHRRIHLLGFWPGTTNCKAMAIRCNSATFQSYSRVYISELCWPNKQARLLNSENEGDQPASQSQFNSMPKSKWSASNFRTQEFQVHCGRHCMTLHGTAWHCLIKLVCFVGSGSTTMTELSELFQSRGREDGLSRCSSKDSRTGLLMTVSQPVLSARTNRSETIWQSLTKTMQNYVLLVLLSSCNHNKVPSPILLNYPAKQRGPSRQI